MLAARAFAALCMLMAAASATAQREALPACGAPPTMASRTVGLQYTGADGVLGSFKYNIQSDAVSLHDVEGLVWIECPKPGEVHLRFEGDAPEELPWQLPILGLCSGSYPGCGAFEAYEEDAPEEGEEGKPEQWQTPVPGVWEVVGRKKYSPSPDTIVLEVERRNATDIVDDADFDLLIADDDDDAAAPAPAPGPDSAEAPVLAPLAAPAPSAPPPPYGRRLQAATSAGQEQLAATNATGATTRGRSLISASLTLSLDVNKERRPLPMGTLVSDADGSNIKVVKAGDSTSGKTKVADIRCENCFASYRVAVRLTGKIRLRRRGGSFAEVRASGGGQARAEIVIESTGARTFEFFDNPDLIRVSIKKIGFERLIQADAFGALGVSGDITTSTTVEARTGVQITHRTWNMFLSTKEGRSVTGGGVTFERLGPSLSAEASVTTSVTVSPALGVGIIIRRRTQVDARFGLDHTLGLTLSLQPDVCSAHASLDYSLTPAVRGKFGKKSFESTFNPFFSANLFSECMIEGNGQPPPSPVPPSPLPSRFTKDIKFPELGVPLGSFSGSTGFPVRRFPRFSRVG